ncbi:MAG: PQQ-binding-like beta-propeller repeat protein, partial [Thermoguttaceae bacterium]
NGEGIAPAAAIPDHWTEKDYRWKTELPGAGYSSPVICDSRLFVTSTLDEDATQIVLCLSTADGALLWEQRFASKPHKHHPNNSYAASTPALDGDSLYFLWANPEQFVVVKLEQATGQEQWRRDLGAYAAEHAVGASPIVYQNLVIVPNEQDGASSILALDRRTGKTVWQAERRTEKTAYATPCVYVPEAGPAQLIVSSWAHGLSGLDPDSGKTLWELPVFQNRVVGSPMIASGLIFAAAGTGGIGRQMFAVRPGEPARGVEAKVAYELKGSLPYVVTPIASGDLVFAWFDKGVVTCLEAASGEVLWKERIGGEYFGSPVLVGERLYCVSREGEVVVLAASRQFKELGRVPLGEASHSTPAVAGGVMYLRTTSHVMALAGP